MDNKLRNMILAGLFAGLMVVGAFIKIPNPFLPAVMITFQLFFCVFAGLLLKPIYALASQLIYIVIGLIGIPVFSGGGGFDYVFRPTFGFLIGFAVAAYIIALLVEYMGELTFLKIFGAALLGATLNYAIGIVYMFMINGGSIVGLTVAMTPYYIKDTILVIIAAIAALRIIPALRKAGY